MEFHITEVFGDRDKARERKVQLEREGRKGVRLHEIAQFSVQDQRVDPPVSLAYVEGDGSPLFLVQHEG